jgi:hypothetical protein
MQIFFEINLCVNDCEIFVVVVSIDHIYIYIERETPYNKSKIITLPRTRLPIKVLKMDIDVLAPPLSEIMNHCIRDNTIPDDWIYNTER